MRELGVVQGFQQRAALRSSGLCYAAPHDPPRMLHVVSAPLDRQHRERLLRVLSLYLPLVIARQLS